MNKIIHGDCLDELKNFNENTVDCLVTDPPYGYSFMGKNWDKAVPSVDIWKECLRVLKPGAFAFIMSAPRQDVLSQMIVRITEAGFDTNFTSIYWTYASGFPKAMNIGKMVDKRNGTSPDESREFAAYIKDHRIALGITLSKADEDVCGGTTNYSWFEGRPTGQRLPRLTEYERIKTLLNLDNRFDTLMGEAEREVLASKQKLNTYSDQGYSSGIGEYERITVDITAPATAAAKLLDGSYGGFQPKPAVEIIIVAMKPLSEKTFVDQALKNGKGITWLDDCRVPTVDSNVGWNGLSNKVFEHSGNGIYQPQYNKNGDSAPTTGRFPANLLVSDDMLGDNSRYFDLDAWAKTYPFLIVSKTSKREKNTDDVKNTHSTVKPLKLMSYLITLGSREGDIVLDPFLGSGTTALASKNLKRKYLGIEREKEYIDIANARLQEEITPLF